MRRSTAKDEFNLYRIHVFNLNTFIIAIKNNIPQTIEKVCKTRQEGRMPYKMNMKPLILMCSI